ncbi:MAG: host attachment protein [Caldimonas sp.]
MKTECILVADAASARFFRRESDADPLIPLETVTHDASRQKASALGDDRLGHGSRDRSPGGVSFVPHTDPKRREHEHFARQIALRLEQALERGECRRISIYAPARFLGELRAALGPATSKSLRVTIDIDLIRYGLDELERRIAGALALHGTRPKAPIG